MTANIDNDMYHRRSDRMIRNDIDDSCANLNDDAAKANDRREGIEFSFVQISPGFKNKVKRAEVKEDTEEGRGTNMKSMELARQSRGSESIDVEVGDGVKLRESSKSQRSSIDEIHGGRKLNRNYVHNSKRLSENILISLGSKDNNGSPEFDLKNDLKFQEDSKLEKLPRIQKRLTFAKLGMSDDGFKSDRLKEENMDADSNQRLEVELLQHEEKAREPETLNPQLSCSLVNKSSMVSSGALERLRKGAKMIQIQARMKKFFKDSIKDERKSNDPNLFRWKDFVDNGHHDSFSKLRSGKTIAEPNSPLHLSSLKSKDKSSFSTSSPPPKKQSSSLPSSPPSSPRASSKVLLKCQLILTRIFESPIVSYLYSLLIVISIFGDDMRRLLTGYQSDNYSDSMLFFIMLIFTIEIICNIVRHGRRYLCSSDVWFDTIATLSIVIELSMVSETYLAPYEK